MIDNLLAHEGGKIKEIAEGAGYELLYLPLYSPNLNPIERTFAKVKRLLRRTKALIESMDQALDAGTTRDVRRSSSITATAWWTNHYTCCSNIKHTLHDYRS